MRPDPNRLYTHSLYESWPKAGSQAWAASYPEVPCQLPGIIADYRFVCSNRLSTSEHHREGDKSAHLGSCTKISISAELVRALPASEANLQHCRSGTGNWRRVFRHVDQWHRGNIGRGAIQLFCRKPRVRAARG